MNNSQQEPTIPPSGEILEPANLTIDMSFIAEGFRTMAQDNKRMLTELTKLRELHNVNQKLNDELKKYQQGALKQSKEDLLRSIAQIYSEYKRDVKNADALKFILTNIKNLLEDHEVEFTNSKPGVSFDRKYMKTYADHVVLTNEQRQDRTVAESLEQGYVFFGEPIIQELVKMYKYEPEEPIINTEINEVEINNEEKESMETIKLESNDTEAETTKNENE